MDDHMLKQSERIVSGKGEAQTTLDRFANQRISDDANILVELWTSHRLYRELKARRDESPRCLVRDFLETFPLLLAWNRVQRPERALRVAILKQARDVWNVRRSQKCGRRSNEDMVRLMEQQMLPAAIELLKGGAAQHAHLRILDRSSRWTEQEVQATPSELGNEALTRLLSDIRSWLDTGRRTDWKLNTKAHAAQREATTE